jgi:hypothetical protein
MPTTKVLFGTYDNQGGKQVITPLIVDSSAANVYNSEVCDVRGVTGMTLQLVNFDGDANVDGTFTFFGSNDPRALGDKGIETAFWTPVSMSDSAQSSNYTTLHGTTTISAGVFPGGILPGGTTFTDMLFLGPQMVSFRFFYVSFTGSGAGAPAGEIVAFLSTNSY